MDVFNNTIKSVGTSIWVYIASGVGVLLAIALLWAVVKFVMHRDAKTLMGDLGGSGKAIAVIILGLAAIIYLATKYKTLATNAFTKVASLINQSFSVNLSDYVSQAATIMTTLFVAIVTMALVFAVYSIFLDPGAMREVSGLIKGVFVVIFAFSVFAIAAPTVWDAVINGVKNSNPFEKIGG